MFNLDFLTLWRELAPPDLPAPIPEYHFHAWRRWRFDYAWPDRRVAVEFDGGQWKPGGGRHNTDRDREKLNVAAALGWSVLRFSTRAWADDPAYCVNMAVAACVLNAGGGELLETPAGDLRGGGDPGGLGVVLGLSSS